MIPLLQTKTADKAHTGIFIPVPFPDFWLGPGDEAMDLQTQLPKPALILPVPLDYHATNHLRNNLAFFCISFLSPWHVFGLCDPCFYGNMWRVINYDCMVSSKFGGFSHDVHL